MTYIPYLFMLNNVICLYVNVQLYAIFKASILLLQNKYLIFWLLLWQQRCLFLCHSAATASFFQQL